MGMETVKCASKEARNQMFNDLRLNGNEFERQVVKFSESELVDGKGQDVYYVSYPTE